MRDVLRPLEDRHPGGDLATAAEVLLDAQRTLADEILLVDMASLEVDD